MKWKKPQKKNLQQKQRKKQTSREEGWLKSQEN